MSPPPFEPTEHNVRERVGRSYDRDHGDPPERFQPSRRLTVTALPGAYERASHAAIAIQGTPTRGMVIVDLEYENLPAVDIWSHRALSMPETAMLRRFAIAVRAEVGGDNTNDWRWTSPLPDPK